ncbi:hypothetical protein ASG68_22445 [Rhizobium sp. Leaf453]|nr:hypothetical protein ASG50_19140 [Rhizobium sp. Leaf386]KQT03237.1 hypothetical protein ASG42_24840 [Rhizobium sp. Leaf391]KQU08354.1 hypothetical protein ASG68_22445 [Rhizobium sp. Leaf453]
MRRVWKAEHIYEDGELDEYAKLIGYFSTRALARAAVKRVKDQPGFKKYSKGFVIGQVAIDRVGWSQGFIRWKEA